jgi:tetratricopeptide (TPR) repeat protein
MRETILETSTKTILTENTPKLKAQTLQTSALIAVLVITALFCFHILSLYFVTFDEELSNISITIQTLNWANFQKLYTNQNNFNNILSYFLLHKEVQWYQLSPKGYHFISYLLHISNVGLAFYATWLLTKRNVIAIVAAVLFALHPTRSESMAGILGQGELLMAFFALLSTIFYLRYEESRHKDILKMNERITKYLYYSFGFFVLAVLTKFTAATLPLVFILIDFTKSRTESKIWSEKIPFWLVMLATIILAGALQIEPNSKTYFGVPEYNIIDRIILAFTTLGLYLKNLLFPFDLSPFYPYPTKIGFFLNWTSYLFALLPFILGFIVWKFKNHKYLAFGFLFLFIHILLISNILPLGSRTFAKDSHIYFAGLGIFIAFGYGIDYLLTQNPKKYLQIVGISSTLALGLAVMTYFYDEYYENGMTLWTKMVITNLDHYYPRLKRGDIRTLNQDYYREGMQDLNEALRLMPDDPETWNSKGYMHMHIGDYKGADSLFTQAIKRNPRHPLAYFHRAHTLKGYERYDQALLDYNKTIEINPNYAPAYLNRGGVKYYLKDYNGALKDYSKAIELNNDYEQAFQNRGNLYFAANSNQEAMKDYNRALQLNPQNAEVLFYRGILRGKLGDRLNACVDLNAAKNLGKKEADKAIEEICK